ncbi:MAG: hypothetical protein OXU20_34680 [Myxococcales bacterium]|nr:hypothetical protein [Myxococcales bacterium]
MSERPHDLQRMLELYRADGRPPAEVEARVWQAVHSRIAPTAPSADAAQTGTEVGSSPEGAGATSTPASWASATKIALAGGVLLVVAGAFYGLTRREAPPHETPARGATIEEPAAEATGSTATPSDPPKRGTVVTAAPSPVAAAEPAPHSPPITAQPAASEAASPSSTVAKRKRRRMGARSTSSLAAEMKLMTAAQAASRRGNHRQAMTLLRAHGRRFPHGVMAEEREAERVLSLCEVGRRAAARRAAKRFVARFSGSPHTARVLAACKDSAP